MFQISLFTKNSKAKYCLNFIVKQYNYNCFDVWLKYLWNNLSNLPLCLHAYLSHVLLIFFGELIANVITKKQQVVTITTIILIINCKFWKILNPLVAQGSTLFNYWISFILRTSHVANSIEFHLAFCLKIKFRFAAMKTKKAGESPNAKRN